MVSHVDVTSNATDTVSFAFTNEDTKNSIPITHEVNNQLGIFFLPIFISLLIVLQLELPFPLFFPQNLIVL